MQAQNILLRAKRKRFKKESWTSLLLYFLIGISFICPFVLSDSFHENERHQMYQSFNYDFSVSSFADSELSEDLEQELSQSATLAARIWMENASYQNKDITLRYSDHPEEVYLTWLEGRAPQNSDEIAVDSMTAMLRGFSIGDQIELETSDGIERKTLTGIIDDWNGAWLSQSSSPENIEVMQIQYNYFLKDSKSIDAVKEIKSRSSGSYMIQFNDAAMSVGYGVLEEHQVKANFSLSSPSDWLMLLKISSALFSFFCFLYLFRAQNTRNQHSEHLLHQQGLQKRTIEKMRFQDQFLRAGMAGFLGILTGVGLCWIFLSTISSYFRLYSLTSHTFEYRLAFSFSLWHFLLYLLLFIGTLFAAWLYSLLVKQKPASKKRLSRLPVALRAVFVSPIAKSMMLFVFFASLELALTITSCCSLIPTASTPVNDDFSLSASGAGSAQNFLDEYQLLQKEISLIDNNLSVHVYTTCEIKDADHPDKETIKTEIVTDEQWSQMTKESSKLASVKALVTGLDFDGVYETSMIVYPYDLEHLDETPMEKMERWSALIRENAVLYQQKAFQYPVNQDAESEQNYSSPLMILPLSTIETLVDPDSTTGLSYNIDITGSSALSDDQIWEIVDLLTADDIDSISYFSSSDNALQKIRSARLCLWMTALLLLLELLVSIAVGAGIWNQYKINTQTDDQILIDHGAAKRFSSQIKAARILMLIVLPAGASILLYLILWLMLWN